MKNYHQIWGRPPIIKKLSKETLKKKIKKIKAKNYIGSELVDWRNIDFKAGMGIEAKPDIYFWTKKGKRITLRTSRLCSSKTIDQIKQKDPYYPRKDKNMKNTFLQRIIEKTKISKEEKDKMWEKAKKSKNSLEKPEKR